MCTKIGIRLTALIIGVRLVLLCETKTKTALQPIKSLNNTLVSRSFNSTLTRKSWNTTLLGGILNSTLSGRTSSNTSTMALVTSTASNKPCTKKWQRVTKKLKAKKKLGRTISDLFPPSCDALGYFKPVQCNTGGCYCVDKYGKLYNSIVYRVSWLPEHVCTAQSQ